MAATLKEIVNPTLEDKLKAYKEYKIMQEQVKQELAKLETDIKDILEELGETNVACGSYKCTVSTVSRENFNKKIVQEQYPELYEQCIGHTTYTRFTVK